MTPSETQPISAAITADSLPDPRQELLLHACLCPPERIAPYWREWRTSTDIDNLDDASNRLLPLLFRQAEAARVQDPEMARLRGIYRYHWCRNQLLLGELRSVLAALHAASVEVLLLKGAALIDRYYKDPGLRPMSDLDLMVRPEQIKTSCATLERLGWTPKVLVDFEKVLAQRLIHAVDFVREKNGRKLEVDLHWTPLHRATWPEAERPFWQHALHTEAGGIPCRLLDPTHQLLHTCLHGGLWNAMPPFRWVADAMWVLRVDAERIDWDRLLDEARMLNGFQILKATLAYLHERFEAPIPDQVMRRLARNCPSRFELLEYRLQTKRIGGARIDELLLLEWFNHSRAFPRGQLWRRLVTFPNYLRLAWKLAHWRQVPGFVLKRLAVRLGLLREGGAPRTARD